MALYRQAARSIDVLKTGLSDRQIDVLGRYATVIARQTEREYARAASCRRVEELQAHAWTDPLTGIAEPPRHGA